MAPSIKSVLVTAYFNFMEIMQGIEGMFPNPAARISLPDYEGYWLSRETGSWQPRFQIVADSVQRDESVLDIGCGDGVLLEHLTKARQATGIGLDISKIAVHRARLRNLDVRCQTLNEFREQNQCLRFHHVVMSEVLEHVQNPEELLLLAWSLCRKTLWVTFPNIAYFPHRLRLLAGKFPVQWVVFPGEHLRFWSVPDFRHWLQQQHLPIATLSASNGITLLGLHRLWPNLLANQIVARIDKDSAA